MKVSCLLCFLSATFWFYLMPTTGNKTFQFGPCTISVNVNEIRASFTAIKATIVSTVPCAVDVERPHLREIGSILFKSADRCCIIHHLLRFYIDKVFKHCETEDSHVNRKISSIANSFLSIKKKFRQCHEKNVCDCKEEAIEKYKQILTNYGQLNVTSAAMKSLGELDILLDWMEKIH
uniref:Interleukin family protein n=1 Tax=Pelusios castaneus TaxID=367368 RepID=A0A8C8SC72_9SAUR